MRRTKGTATVTEQLPPDIIAQLTGMELARFVNRVTE
jgi:hypothetical protein